MLPQCVLTVDQVSSAFLAAPPALSSQILDLTVKSPNWMRDLYAVEEWQRGNGTTMQQLIFRGQMPQIERGFDKWKRQGDNSGCAPCEGPDCGYNWTTLGGFGLERKITHLMSREYRSEAFCIKEIQTTMQFKEVFAKIVQNLFAQINFVKEINIGQNAITSLAKKFVVDSAGAKPNTANPYVYPNIGTATLATLNINMLTKFYEYMRKTPDAVPYDVVDGSPIFALMASHELLARLYRDDEQARKDVRFSGLANDLVMKYNFMSTIQGMFIAAPVLFPRRFNIVNGEPVEVLPYVNNVPMEVGSSSGFNYAYESATHEEVLLHGKFPFKIFYMPTEQTLGANTSFGPEFSLFNSWSWVNPQTTTDPFRRVGFFATSADIGLSQQFSDAIYGILVARPPDSIMAAFLCAPACPPTPVECDNVIPDTGCPCPLILNVVASPMNAGSYFITVAAPLDVAAEDTIQFGLTTGGYITGTVEDVNTDGTIVEVSFAGDPTLALCDFTSIFCDNSLGCSAKVLSYNVNCADGTQLNLVLGNPIKADTVADTVTVYYGNGSSVSATVVSVDMLTNTWVVDIGGTAFCDQVGGVVSICVPPGTDATCPACGTGPTFTQCTT